MNRTYYPAMDAVKLVCAVMIVFIHIAPLESVDGRLNSFLVNCLCRIAVPFFFISSGFLLFRKMRPDAVDFGIIGRYLRRIFRLYMIWSAVYFPYTALQMYWDRKNALPIFLGWLKNMVFSAGFGFLWYLPATIVAVALVAFLLKRGMKLRTVIAVGVLLYIIGLFGQSWYGLVAGLPFPQGFVDAVKTVYSVIGTTRNGVFEGMVFVALGAALAAREDLGTFRRAASGFLVSMLLLTAEFACVARFGQPLEYDLYFFLLPAAYYLLRAVLTAKIGVGERVCGILRPCSSLIYFTHMIPVTLLTEYYPVIGNSLLLTAAVLACTGILTAAILLASGTRPFGFLKKIY